MFSAQVICHSCGAPNSGACRCRPRRPWEAKPMVSRCKSCMRPASECQGIHHHKFGQRFVCSTCRQYVCDCKCERPGPSVLEIESAITSFPHTSKPPVFGVQDPSAVSPSSLFGVQASVFAPHPSEKHQVYCDLCRANPRYADESIRSGKYCKDDGMILGIRYKSMVCADYDLCETCEARDGATSSEAPFMKIRTHDEFKKLMSRMNGAHFISYNS